VHEQKSMKPLQVFLHFKSEPNAVAVHDSRLARRLLDLTEFVAQILYDRLRCDVNARLARAVCRTNATRDEGLQGCFHQARQRFIWAQHAFGGLS
jgi:hypothetical protein